MKTQERRGVFETNSSSTHSIHIDESAELLDTLPLNEGFFYKHEDRWVDEGALVLEGGEFGWEIYDHYDALTKANYMAVYAKDWSRDVLYEGQTLQEILVEVLTEQTGCKEVIFKFDGSVSSWNKEPNEDREWAYIDHQSVEDMDWHYIFEDKELLRMFLFNPSSYVHTDNDNH